jgi:hypothetical protein
METKAASLFKPGDTVRFIADGIQRTGRLADAVNDIWHVLVNGIGWFELKESALTLVGPAQGTTPAVVPFKVGDMVKFKVLGEEYVATVASVPPGMVTLLVEFPNGSKRVVPVADCKPASAPATPPAEPEEPYVPVEAPGVLNEDATLLSELSNVVTTAPTTTAVVTQRPYPLTAAEWHRYGDEGYND